MTAKRMIAALMLLTCPSAAEEPAPSTAARPQLDAQNGIWPTDGMIDALLARWADDTAVKYELDAEKTALLRETMTRRWSAFLAEHRAVLRPLLNDYIEARIAAKPPSPELVRDWTKRALPLFERVRTQLHETREELKPLVDPTQRIKLDFQGIKMNAALGLFQSRLEAWSRGEFTQQEWWQPTERARQHSAKRGDAEPSAPDVKTAPSLAKTRIDEELLRWDHFVAEFLDRLKLDSTQRLAAYSVLRECKQRALDHRDRHRARLEKFEKTAAESDTPDQTQREEAVALYEPVDKIFTELTKRLEQIPTTAQNAAAESDVKTSGTKHDTP